jgi:hypothetical protein
MDQVARSMARWRDEMDTAMLTKTMVAERDGWSLSLVDRLLGEPDQRKRFHGFAEPIGLYKLSRVEKAEASGAFQAEQAAREKAREERSLAAELAEVWNARLLREIDALTRVCGE